MSLPKHFLMYIKIYLKYNMTFESGRASLDFPHVHHASDAISRLHVLKCSVDVIQWLPVRDEFIHLQLAGHVIVHQVRELRAAFDAAEGASFPYTAGDELEC